MATRNSLFVDTSGWAYLADRSTILHHEVQTAYQQALTRQRLLVTTNYIIAELVALLTSRSRISRQQIVLFIDALKSAPHVEVIHMNTELDAEAWILLKARIDKEWSLVDASSFVVMTKYGMTDALTTDHHFTQAGFFKFPSLKSSE
ncbi:MAG TPA: PIN domain-containing protein [Ktedonobacteraceae bacterium]|nr:PIN domain-containing protein [Ktedonobacteraceae bacterium]